MRYAGIFPRFWARRFLPLQCLVAFLWVLCFGISVLADTARISGTVFTVDSGHVQIPWPNARVTLKSLASGRELVTVSGDLGQYSFAGMLPGEYQLSVVLAGFAPFSKRITLGATAPSIVDVQLAPQSQSEAITVRANSTDVDTSSSSGGGPVLSAGALKSLVRLNDDFQEALPLLPGVLRGPDGLIRVKGGNANQVNALINNASIGDPFTGQPALRLPTAAVESMRVLSNPFSAEFGGFSSGVIDVTTRGGGDEWKWLFEDPVPRFRWIDGSTHGMESLTPHLAFSGPLIKGKLFIFQSLYLGYDTVRVPSLPDPDNVRIDKRVNTQTQLDWDISPSHRLTAILTVDPEDTAHANIDTFNPPPVTNDYRQRGFFASISDRWILPSGGYVESLFSLKRLDFELFPENPQPGAMTLFPEGNSGSFFANEDRDTWLLQWNQALHLRPVSLGGRHLFTFGYAVARSTYRGTQANLPVRVLREDGTLSSAITYGPEIFSSAASNNVALYFQDNWQLLPRLALDVGLRLDHQSLASEVFDAAPRIGFVFAPGKDNRTAIRGGVGLFYDKIPLNVAIFPNFPAQTITQFAADGATMVEGPTTYTHVIATNNGVFGVPYSVGATLQFDRKLRQNVLIRLGYQHRQGHREFFINPVSGTPLAAAQLRLLNSGAQRYDEFLAMARWNPTERTTLVASYVRSRALGELNDYNQFFGNNPYPLIRPNQYGRLPSDAPDRFLLWGTIGLPYRLQFVPILDTHTGFPYSKLDRDWNYIGARDEAGRFPTFASLDLKLQYPFDFKVRGHRIQFLGGIKVIDITNHYNPRDVQQYLGSPFYGVFYNSVGRLWRIDGDFDF